jgi:ribosomal protein S20
MENASLKSIKEKLKEYDAEFENLSKIGSSISADIEESIQMNYKSMESFGNSVNYLKSIVSPFMEKYSEFQDKVEEMEQIKSDFADISAKAKALYERARNFSMIDITPLKESLSSILEYSAKMEQSEENAYASLAELKEGIAGVSEYFTKLRKGLEGKIASANIDIMSKKGLEQSTKRINDSLLAPKAQIKSKDLVVEKSGLEAEIKKNSSSEQEIIDFLVQTTIYEFKEGVRLSTIIEKYENCESAVDSLAKKGIIIKNKKSTKFSDTFKKSKEQEIDEGINNNPNINQDRIMEYLSSHNNTTYKGILTALCHNNSEKILLCYKLGKMKELGEIEGEKAVIRKANKQ